MVFLLHLVLGAALSGINCANSPPPSSSILSRLNYVPWKQPPAADVEWLHTKSVPQWSPRQTSDKVTCNANHLHQAKLKNIESISPKNDELHPGKRRKRDGALNFAEKDPLGEGWNDSAKMDADFRLPEKYHLHKFFPSKKVNLKFSVDKNTQKDCKRGLHQRENELRFTHSDERKMVSSFYAPNRTWHEKVGKNHSTPYQTFNSNASKISSDRESLGKITPVYNISEHRSNLKMTPRDAKIQRLKPLPVHNDNKKQKVSKRSHLVDVGDCRENFSSSCVEKSTVRKPWRGRSGRTTSRREALVRASLITEDRSYTLKMLPTNRVVGLTLQPGSQHRLLLPVERSYGPLSLTIAPCGDTLSWSLTRRPLPKVTETREALDREGQSGDQVDLGSQMWGGSSVYGDRAARGENEGVIKTEQEGGNTSVVRDVMLIEDREKNSQERTYETALKKETERGRKEDQYARGLSENDVLYEEGTIAEEQGNERNEEQTGESGRNSTGESDSEETHVEQKDENFSSKRRNSNQELYLENYLQKAPRQYESERERRTLKNIFSLKNLAFDIGKSDFYDNEANRLLYKDEYDEMLRHQREKRGASLENCNGDEHGHEKISQTFPVVIAGSEMKRNRTYRNETQKIGNNYYSRPVQIIFEDPVHTDWRKGNYFDHSKVISPTPAAAGDELLKPVIFVHLRRQLKHPFYSGLQNRFSVEAGQSKHILAKENNKSEGIDSKLANKLNIIAFNTDENPPLNNKIPEPGFSLLTQESNDSFSLSKYKLFHKLENDSQFSSRLLITGNEISIFENQLERPRTFSKIQHSNDNKQVLASESRELVRDLASKSSLPFRAPRSSVSDALTTSTPFQSHSNLDTNSSIASDFGRYFRPTKEVTPNQMKEKPFPDFGQMERQRSYSRLSREISFTGANRSHSEEELAAQFVSFRRSISAPTHVNTAESSAASPSLSEMISNVRSRRRHRILKNSWRRRNLSQVPTKVQFDNGGEEIDELSQSLPTGVEQVASRTIWGRASRYDLLDRGAGDRVWSYVRTNVTAGVYVLTISSSSGWPASIQVEANRRRIAASDTSHSPVTAMVSRRPSQPPVLTISWLRNPDASTEKFPGINRFSKNLKNGVYSGINQTHHSYEPLLSKIAFSMNQSVSGTKISSTISSLQALKSPEEIEKRSSKEGHKQYCLALSEERQYDSLCRARASREPSIKLGCTRLTRYSLPLVVQQFPAPKKAKRYYVTVWQSGSLVPLGQTSLRGSGRGKVPHLRQGILHKILLSAGGAATAKFRIRKSPQRLHVAAVACKGGLSITVREGGPDGLKVVEAGGRSALIVSVRHPPKGLLHLTVTPFTPHSSHTLLIAAATSAKRLPLPRLPHSLTVRADVTSCNSGIITWQSAPGRPKYCVLLEEVIGRPKITWPPIQCGWESKLAVPTTLAHCSPGYKGRRQTWQLLRLKEDTTYTITVLITHRFSNRTLSIAPTVLYTPPCS